MKLLLVLLATFSIFPALAQEKSLEYSLTDLETEIRILEDKLDQTKSSLEFDILIQSSLALTTAVLVGFTIWNIYLNRKFNESQIKFITKEFRHKYAPDIRIAEDSVKCKNIQLPNGETAKNLFIFDFDLINKGSIKAKNPKVFYDVYPNKSNWIHDIIRKNTPEELKQKPVKGEFLPESKKHIRLEETLDVQEPQLLVIWSTYNYDEFQDQILFSVLVKGGEDQFEVKAIFSGEAINSIKSKN